MAYSASPSMDLLLHNHQRIKKQKEKGKEKEMTRRRRWGSRSGGKAPGSATGVGGDDWRLERRRGDDDSKLAADELRAAACVTEPLRS